MHPNSAPVRVVLAGLGGYGNLYVDALLNHGPEHQVQVVAAADPAPRACRRLGELLALGVPLHPSLEEALAEQSADLVVLSTPIAQHAPQTCAALARGAHVLCEKPLGASCADVRTMVAARDRAARQVGIGYQWSYDEPVLALKRDIMAGLLGAPRRLSTLVLWPRDHAYYHRNRWAGRIRDDEGRWVLDSPVNNAMAHYLHNMLYVLGDRVDRSLLPTSLTAELYRANAIENYDTAALRLRSAAGVEIGFFVSHAVDHVVGPVSRFEFDDAVVTYGGPAGDRFIARFAAGHMRDYGAPDQQDRKLWTMVDCLRSDRPTPCGLEAAAAHTAVMLAASRSSTVTGFSDEQVRAVPWQGSSLVCVAGLGEALQQCYERLVLPSEAGLPWATPGVEVPLADVAAAMGLS